MPLFKSQHHSGLTMRWLGAAATVVVELVVVVALGAAVVRYLEWSSDAKSGRIHESDQAIGVCCKSFWRIFSSDTGLSGP
jgi:hypothetical protein